MRKRCGGVLITALVLGLAPGAQAATPKRISCGKLPKGAKAGRDVACFRLTVPARHEKPGGAKQQIAIGVLKAKQRSGKPALLTMGGGPGETFAATAVQVSGTAGRKTVFGVLRSDRDVYFVDQRGVGGSRPPLGCGPEEKAIPADALNADATLSAALTSAYAQCGARLRKTVDISTFTTSQMAYDVRQVARDFKLGKVDLLTASYGTKVFQLAASRDDSWIRHLVLSSPIAPGANFVQDSPTTFGAALQATFAACAAEPACAAKYPDPKGALEQAIAGLQAQPLGAPAPAPAPSPAPGPAPGPTNTTPSPAPPTGPTGPTTTPPPGGNGNPPALGAQSGGGSQAAPILTAASAMSALQGLYYSPGGPAAALEFIAKLQARDPSLLKAGSTGGGAGDINAAQFFAVECSDDLAAFDPAKALADAGAFGNSMQVFTQNQFQFGPGAKTVCGGFGVTPSGAKPAQLGRIGVPTLVQVGAFDQITSPLYGAAVAKGVKRGRLLTIAEGHAALLKNACGAKALIAFLAGKATPKLCAAAKAS